MTSLLSPNSLAAKAQKAQTLANQTSEIHHVLFEPHEEGLYQIYSDGVLFYKYGDSMNHEIEVTAHPDKRHQKDYLLIQSKLF